MSVYIAQCAKEKPGNIPKSLQDCGCFRKATAVGTTTPSPPPLTQPLLCEDTILQHKAAILMTKETVLDV